MELKKSILIFVVLFSCLFKNFCYADTDYNPNNFGYQDYSYVFNRYDIDIIVNENNTFYITESITAVFNEPKHFAKILLGKTSTLLLNLRTTAL